MNNENLPDLVYFSSSDVKNEPRPFVIEKHPLVFQMFGKEVKGTVLAKEKKDSVTKILSYDESLSCLVRKIDLILDSLWEIYGKKITFQIGKTYAAFHKHTKKQIRKKNFEVLTDPDNWNTKGLEYRWLSRYYTASYEGMVGFAGVVEGDPNWMESWIHDMTFSLEKSLFSQYQPKNLERFEFLRTTPVPNIVTEINDSHYENLCYLLYVSYKIEGQPTWYHR